MLRRPLLTLALLTPLAMMVAGCEEKKEAAPAAPAAPAAAPAAAAPAAAPAAPAAPPSGDRGTVKGTAVVTGKLPVMEELKRQTDPFCAKTTMKDDSVIAGKHGELANVLVHINGLPPTPPPNEAAGIAQDNCMYRPRVMGIVAGQTLHIKNGDPVLHNVHTYKGASTLFNSAQVPGAPDINKTFTDNGALLKLRCDVHQWMTGYVWVQNNSYFAVTDDKGQFEIKDVPVGTYPIEAWHERFGTKTGTVTVAKDKPAEVKFEFVGTETATK
jgi:plastocyanin